MIDVNVWYHLAGTYDGSEMKIYVNGELKNTATVVGSVLEGGKPVYIGNNGGGRYHKGLIDEVAIYNRALTACEINQHYQNGLDGLGYEVVQATIDIDPNTLNLKSKGKMVTAYIELPEGCNMSDIDVNTVTLECSIPAILHPATVGGSCLHPLDGLSQCLGLRQFPGQFPMIFHSDSPFLEYIALVLRQIVHGDNLYVP